MPASRSSSTATMSASTARTWLGAGTLQVAQLVGDPAEQAAAGGDDYALGVGQRGEDLALIGRMPSGRPIPRPRPGQRR